MILPSPPRHIVLHAASGAPLAQVTDATTGLAPAPPQRNQPLAKWTNLSYNMPLMSSLNVPNCAPTAPPLVIDAAERARIAADLAALGAGEVRFDRHHQLLYATDASNYQVEPVGVVLPRTADDVAAIVNYCAPRGIALLPRGGGTSLAGQCTNRALVIDLSRHFRSASELDTASRTCLAQSGITLDELNRWLDAQASGLFFAPDPATSAQATVGGCIGNNAAGARSIVYGRTSENVAAIEVLLSSGQRLWLQRGAGRRDPVALRLAREIALIVTACADEIRSRFPRTTRRNAGYALDLILNQIDAGAGPEDLDLSGLLCGSEGTLAIVLGARLKLHPIPVVRGLAVLSFASLEAAIAAVPAIVATGASAVELLDDVVLSAAAGNAECRRYMRLLPSINGGEAAAVLYVEYQSTNSADEVRQRCDELRRIVPDAAINHYLDNPSLADLWALRKAGEPLLHGLAGHRKPVTVIEDNAVPVENLYRFVQGLKAIIARHGTVAAYYAHASVGVLHVRPLLDLHDPADRERLRAIAVEAADLARECGGVMSGEHGDGRLRGPLLERYFGPRIMDAFRQVKRVFDPAGILNPGMIVDAGPIESIAQSLRVKPLAHELSFPQVETYFDYSDQEDFRGAVERCNGAGVCRRTLVGTMCPSYRGTLDERHSTRGRGNALRLALSGQLPIGNAGPAAWDDPDTIETLDLCLSCKACKSECPSNVDLARLKAEYTAQRYRETGVIPLAARAFGHIRALNRLGSIAPALANWVNSLRPVRAIVNELLDLAPQRSLPPFRTSLYRWFARRQSPLPADAPKVVLFADCFVTYNEPEIGQSAVRVLETLGYRVLFPRVGCCGRSMISNGLLEDAIHSADRVLAQLEPFITDDSVSAIVVCEPSCLSAMTDDWLCLKLHTSKALRQALAAKAMLVEDFIQRNWESHPRRLAVAATAGPAVILHGHCHQKALGSIETSAAVLRRLVGQRLTVLPSGCCGMAGAFGYVRPHYELSMRIGELSLFGPIRSSAADAIILAPGTSCRHQIADGTRRRAMHPIQFIEQVLSEGRPPQ